MTIKENDRDKALVSASYNSPAGSQTFEVSVGTVPSSNDTSSKADYLSNLRFSTKTLQENINTFLTMKMDEEKAIAGSSDKGRKTKDEEEEESYGEEKVEED